MKEVRATAIAAKRKRKVSRPLVIAVLLGSLSAQAWGEDRSKSAEQGVLDARNQAIAAIAGNRSGAIASLVSQWSSEASARGFTQTWESEFSAMLGAATNAQLYDIGQATSYKKVQAILQGRPEPVSTSSGNSIQAFGDTNSDLLFTPVTPCRILDTRFDGDGAVPKPAGNTSNFLVHGTAAQLAPQGHTAGTGCTAPKGEPVGISANFTVVPNAFSGHITPWPFSAPMPTASFVNFYPNTNIANAGIIATCFACGSDMSIFNFSSVNYLVDVMGYFYPAALGNVIETRHGGYDDCCSGQDTVGAAGAFIEPNNGDTTLSFTGGEEVLFWFDGQAFSSATTGNVCGTIIPAYRNTSTLAVTQLGGFENETEIWFAASAIAPQQRHGFATSGRVASMPAGTYEFGIQASKGGTVCSSANNDYVITSQKFRVLKIKH